MKESFPYFSHGQSAITLRIGCALTLLGLCFGVLGASTVIKDSGDASQSRSEWMPHTEFLAAYLRAHASGKFPTVLEGRLQNREWEFRAEFSTLPGPPFTYCVEWGRRGWQMNELTAKLGAEGYKIRSQQTFQDAAEEPIYQTIWIKNKSRTLGVEQSHSGPPGAEIVMAVKALPVDASRRATFKGEIKTRDDSGVSPPVLESHLSGENFNVLMSGRTGTVSLLEASDDLVRWAPLAAVMNPRGTVEFADSNVLSVARRFYRGRIVPAASEGSSTLASTFAVAPPTQPSREQSFVPSPNSEAATSPAKATPVLSEWMAQLKFLSFYHSQHDGGRFPAFIEGRPNSGVWEFRALFIPKPRPVFYYYVEWGRSASEYKACDLRFTKAGYSVLSRQTFQNQDDAPIHQTVWVRNDQLQAAKLAMTANPSQGAPQ